ncbi:hypothetical protein QR680_001273 [Steinernema hermaphroditum]|uniref:DNA2/NAM7 helicase-like C-terminal domain-containing protein n=1 Tax=Steinernema hermaphroditum TaxID=289476 RepID=A0AA39GXN8_9BILA|nr:hypothetical protein QR680_001273 [Steinernema hermaphroditum]
MIRAIKPSETLDDQVTLLLNSMRVRVEYEDQARQKRKLREAKRRAQRLLHMDGEDSFENDGDFMLTSNVADFPSLLTGNKLELVVTEFHKTKEDELFVIGQLCPNNETTVRVFLRGAWCDSPLQIGYRVKIFDPQGYKIKPSTSDTQEADADMEVHVDDKHGLVIIEPNVLISSTTISQSFYCQRKAVLLERFRGASASNSAMLIGNCVHMLFQSALIEKTVVIDDKWLLDKFYKSILPGVAIQMIGIKMTPESLENEIKPYFKIITEWINHEEGMNVSLLEGLAYNDGFMVSLNEQYRMNSTLFYAGRMTCGNDEVASRTVFIENKENIDPLQRDGFGLCLSTSLDDSVILIDTSRCSASKFAERVGGAQGDIFNQGEAVYIATLCTTFIEKLVSPCDIGVMVTYKYQAKVIKEMLEDSRIEVNTVDQYQGREKKVMIMSLVHTDFNRNCELLSDPRRINVAVSRAQAKLIIVGHSERCRHYFVMKELFQSIPKKFILSDM